LIPSLAFFTAFFFSFSPCFPFSRFLSKPIATRVTVCVTVSTQGAMEAAKERAFEGAKQRALEGEGEECVVAIVGASFAGLSVVRHLRAHGRRALRVVLVDANAFFEYKPGVLHMLAGSGVERKLLVRDATQLASSRRSGLQRSIADVAPYCEFIQGIVTNVDEDAHGTRVRVHVRTAEGNKTITAHALVVHKRNTCTDMYASMRNQQTHRTVFAYVAYKHCAHATDLRWIPS
jgi:hypothetical protein